MLLKANMKLKHSVSFDCRTLVVLKPGVQTVTLKEWSELEQKEKV